MIVYCATSNPGKLREFQLAAPDFDVRALPSKIPAPEEHGQTFEENAILKAEYYGRFAAGCSARDCYLFADDSGLEVDALGGAPGVYSARYAGPKATDRDNNALLLERLKHSSASDSTSRTARFVCVIALVRDAKLVKTFRGAVEGRILDSAQGSGGFGYDPLFYYEPFGCTFGQAPIEDKMKVSHRAQALEKMFAFLRTGDPDYFQYWFEGVVSTCGLIASDAFWRVWVLGDREITSIHYPGELFEQMLGDLHLKDLSAGFRCSLERAGAARVVSAFVKELIRLEQITKSHAELRDPKVLLDSAEWRVLQAAAQGVVEVPSAQPYRSSR